MTRSQTLILGLFLALAGNSVGAAQDTADANREAQRLTRVAHVAQQQGRYEDAIKAYQTISVIAKGSPKIAASALLGAGKVYMATGRFPEAATSFRDYADGLIGLDRI